MNTTKYTFKVKAGIDDLKSLFAFHGNSQGDRTVTNSIDDFNNSKGWLSFLFDCELTEEAIAKEIKRRIRWNNNYIKKLKREGSFGKEYENVLEIVKHPIFDEPINNLNVADAPLTSYSFLLLDTNK